MKITSARSYVALGGFALLWLVALVVLATSSSGTTVGPLVISEFMPSNGEFVDDRGEPHDWLEIANMGDDELSLNGHFLSDDIEALRKWQLPAVVLGPGEHVRVWASGLDRRGPTDALHTNFRISRHGEPLLLTAPDGTTVLDHHEPVSLPRNLSYGRHPDNAERTCVFVSPTPGMRNSADCLDRSDIDPPTLMPAGGFYDDAIDVAITANATDEPIYYTLDGSYPDIDNNPDATHVYTGRVPVADRSAEANRLTEFVPTVLVDWLPPSSPVDKATVVRARTRFSQEATATYFVGSHLRRPNLPVVSIASDVDHLFDHDTGIMVPGRRFEEWRWGPDYNPNYPPRWQPANYLRSGRQWERPHQDDLDRAIVFTYCTADGACEFSQNVGLRIHGGVSRMRAQKSLRIYARNDYGNPIMEFPFFGPDGLQTHRRLVLRNSGSDWGQSMLMDGYLQSLMTHLPLDTQAYQPTVTFINGEYWGILNLRERQDRHYLAIAHDLDPDRIIMLEQGSDVIWGSDGDESAYQEFLHELANRDPASPGTEAFFREHVDVENLIDYLIVQLFTSNADWPHNNVRMWRYRASEADELHPGDGRWRYVVFDLDASAAFGGQLVMDRNDLNRILTDADSISASSGIPHLAATLWGNPALRTAFLTRFADHLNTTFVPSRTVAELDELEALLGDEMELHAQRWNQQQSIPAWRDHVDRLRTFMTQRPALQRHQLTELFDLAGSATVRIAHDPQHGTVQVNTVAIASETPGVHDPSSWQGEYFTGVPITVAATPADGHRFVRWHGIDGASSTNPAVTFELTEDRTITAEFAKR